MTTSTDFEIRSFSGSDRRRLTELLAGYLCSSQWFRWPGADGITVGEVVEAAYPAAADAGHVPGLAELTRRHADLADAIAGFFRRDRLRLATAG